MSTSVSPTLESQLSSFQDEVRSLFVELGAEIRTEQITQRAKLNEALTKIDIGHITIHKMQENLDRFSRVLGRLGGKMEERACNCAGKDGGSGDGEVDVVKA